MNRSFFKIFIFIFLLGTNWQQVKAQFAGAGVYGNYSINSVGRNSVIWETGDQFQVLNPGFGILGIGEGKYMYCNTDLLGLGYLIQAPNKSMRGAKSATICNYEFVFRIAEFSESLTLGLGGMISWRKEGMILNAIPSNSYEVYRGGLGRDKNYGDPIGGSGEYFIRHRMGIGPQAHLIYDIDETFYLRGSYTLSTYGTKGSFQSVELSSFIVLDEVIAFNLSLRTYSKKFENPKDFTEGNSPSTNPDVYFLPDKFSVNTIQFTFGVYITID